MKKRKMTLAIACMAILAVGITVFVGCKKEDSYTKKESTFVPLPKSATASDQFANAIIAYYDACDNAYRANSSSFLDACNNEDIATFLNITGISEDLLNTYKTSALQKLEEFMNDQPDHSFDEAICTSCATNALSQIGEFVSQSSGNSATIISAIVTSFDCQQIIDCIYCFKDVESSSLFSANISACLGSYICNDLVEKSTLGSFSHEDNTIKFDIDKENFRSVLEVYLSQIENAIIVVEEVDIIDANPLDPTYKACLQINYFNTENGESTKLATVIDKETNEENGTIIYKSKSSKGDGYSVKCKSSECGQGQCTVVFDSHGVPIDCTSCPKACNKEITADVNTVSFWDILIAVCEAIAAVGPMVKI
ncbi:MAG: hypothetical protein IKY79_01840 [Bacteroidales bacterium]|nr:hypothetical protein [Bacteroidales bacterium]